VYDKYGSVSAVQMYELIDDGDIAKIMITEVSYDFVMVAGDIDDISSLSAFA
jgi:hypothetical protein